MFAAFTAFAQDFGLPPQPSPLTDLTQAQVNVTVNDWQITIIAIVAFLVVVWVVFLLIRKRLARLSYLTSALRQQLLHISIPQPQVEDKDKAQQGGQHLKDEISLAEGLFTVIGSLKAQRGLKSWLLSRSDVFSFEIVQARGAIDFYMMVPNEYQQLVEQQLHTINADAQIEAVEDYNIFEPSSVIVGRHLIFNNYPIFPLKTYKTLESDPVNSVLNSLGKMDNQSTAGIQFVFRSAHRKWRYPGASFVQEIQKGKKINEALAGAGFGGVLDKIFRGIAGLFTLFAADKEKKPEEYKGKPLSGFEEETMKAVEEKMSKAGLEGNLRIVVASPQKALAESYLSNITNSFAQLNFFKYGNVLKESKKKPNRLISDFIHRYYESAYSLLVNSEEAVSLIHLPTSACDAPHIHWLDARTAPPPLNLPREGVILGISNYRGDKQEVRIKVNDRRRHVYIIGKSGTGKSTLMQNMIVQDIQNGDGVCVIDPHGDLVEYVLSHMPKSRAEDVILFDPANLERPMGLNMLEFETSEQKTFVINEMIAIFDKLYDLKATGGPMFEQYMRNAMLLLMEDPESGATLLEVPRVLADESFRAYKLSKCQNPLVKDFWEKEAQKAGGEASLANIVPYITSKLTPFVYSDVMRPIIAQSKSSFNFRQAMDSKKIILLNLTKGRIGEMSSNLLGMVMIGKLLMAALSRVDLPEDQRQDFFLYIDEFQNFITDTIGVILSEARKYKLDLTIGNQFIAQLVKNNDTKIRDSILGNVGTLAAFRLGPEDTEVMAKQFAPVFNERDLLNIPRYNMYLKMLIDGQNAPAFNVQPLPPTPGDPQLAASIKQLSSLKYGRPRAEVEAEVLGRIKMTGGSIEDFNLT